jgi:hypothetical protein
MGSPLSTFNDFMTATGPTFLTGADQVVNEAVKNKYILRRFLKGSDMSRVVQGGKKIKDSLMFDEKSTRKHYQPNDTFTWSNPQVLDDWETDWRFTVDHMSWTDQELELQIGENMTTAGRHQVFKKVKRLKEQRMWTSMMNGFEEDLWAVPSTTDMEAASGSTPYSLACFINENTNGIPLGFSTLEGISQATEAKWRCQKSTYADDGGSGLGYRPDSFLFAAFDEMYYKVKFDSLPTKEEFGKGSSGAKFIACSRNGLTHYQTMLRASNDRLTNSSDPAYHNAKYAGIDLVYASDLDDAAIFNDGGTHKTESAHTLKGGRYWFIDGEYINPVFHTRRYMKRHPVMRHPNQPFTWTQPVDCWHNLICRSVRKQGMVSPSAATTIGSW